MATQDASCQKTSGWLAELIRSYRQSLNADAGTAHAIATDLRAPLDELYDIVMSGDIDSARAVLFSNWTAVDRAVLLTGVIDRLDHAWQHDQVHLTKIAAAFWMIQRLIHQQNTMNTAASGTEPGQGALLLYVPEGEEHSFGVQIFSDGLRTDGWDVEVLFNCETKAVLDSIAQRHFDALGVSIGYDRNLLGLADFIQEARVQSVNARLAILLGGGAFTDPYCQYDFLNADGVFKNVSEAARFLRQAKVGSRPRRVIRHV